MTYLKMPLQLQSAVAKKLQRCSYQESIAQQTPEDRRQGRCRENGSLVHS